MNYNRLRKSEIKDLYSISYPTLRKRLLNAGLEHFIGRRKFSPAEIYIIFKLLGLPKTNPEAVEQFLQEYEAQEKKLTSKKEPREVKFRYAPAILRLRTAAIRSLQLKGLKYELKMRLREMVSLQ